MGCFAKGCLILLALSKVQQRELFFGQRVPGITWSSQRLEPCLNQRWVTLADLMLRPKEARQIAQQWIDRRVACHLVPQGRRALQVASVRL